MSEKLDIKSQSNDKLQKIETEIITTKSNLDRLNYQNNPLLKSQIDELSEKLSQLEKEKQEIISQTQASLVSEKPSTQDVSKVRSSVDNTNLSNTQKQEVKDALKDNWSWFNIEKLQEWIIWIILAILQSFWFWSKEYTEIDEKTWSEIPWSKVDYQKITWKEKQDFVKEASIYAKKIENIYWIPYEISIAQAILESWWWQSGLAKKHWNYFWIKSFWKWEFVTMSTQEEINWKKITIKDWFKKFRNMKESFYWYWEFLTSNPRYKQAFAYWIDLNPKPSHYPPNYIWLDRTKFANELAKAWYATDSKYAAKVSWLVPKIQEIA